LHDVGCNHGCCGYIFVLHSVQYCALNAFALWSGRRRPFVMLCERKP
jgi:hypothetical protein